MKLRMYFEKERIQTIQKRILFKMKKRSFSCRSKLSVDIDETGSLYAAPSQNVAVPVMETFMYP